MAQTLQNFPSIEKPPFQPAMHIFNVFLKFSFLCCAELAFLTFKSCHKAGPDVLGRWYLRILKTAKLDSYFAV